MTPGRLGLHQGLAISTRESGMAPGPGSRTRIWPHVTRHSVQHHGTRVAGRAKGPVHMPPGWLRWQQMAKWYHGDWDGDRDWPHGTRGAGKKDMAT